MIKRLFVLSLFFLAGCSSLDTKLNSLKGFNAGTVTEHRKDLWGNGSFSAVDIKTDSLSGITTIGSATLEESNVIFGIYLQVTDVELDPKSTTNISK